MFILIIYYNCDSVELTLDIFLRIFNEKSEKKSVKWWKSRKIVFRRSADSKSVGCRTKTHLQQCAVQSNLWKMNNDSLEGTVHVTAPSILNKPSQTMPQRSPFAIQELLGLGDSHHHRSPAAAVSAITPNIYNPHQRHMQVPTCFPSEHTFNHHHMTMAASRMAYFNAQAAVAAAFLPHNIAAAAGMNGTPGGASPATVLGLAAHAQGTNSGRISLYNV